MKKIFFYLCLFFTLFSCKNEDNNIVVKEDNITISTESLAFLNTGEAIDNNNSVTVESNGDWQLIGKQSWCHPSIINGKNGDVVTFISDPNPEIENRNTTFSFVCGNKTVKLNIIQKKHNVIELYENDITVPREGGSVTLRISSNTSYEYTLPEDSRSWITVEEPVKSRGLDLSLVTLKVSENDKYSYRKANIVFKAEDGSSAVAQIIQNRHLKLESEKTNYKVDNNGGELSINVSTNLAYRIVVSDDCKDWISYVENEKHPENPDDVIYTTEKFTIKSGVEALRVGRVSLEALDGSLSTSLFIGQMGSTPSEKISIPDINFRKALNDLGFIWTEDIDKEECEITNIGVSATKLDISGRNIESIEGIEHFQKVKTFDCRNNNIRRIDLTKNYIEKPNGETYFTGFSGNPLEYINLGKSWVDYLKLENVPPLNGLTGTNGESSTHLVIIGDYPMAVYIKNNSSLTDLNLYNCPKIYLSYVDINGCAEGKTLNVYVKTGEKPWSWPSNVKLIYEDKQDF